MTSKQSFIRDVIDDAMPLDFTFKKLDTITGSEHDKPREGRVGKSPNRSINGKFLTKAIWLNNNNLTSISGIEDFIKNMLEFPDKLSWIDFSFNQIKEIDPVITSFKNLTILYFHGNLIENIVTAFPLKDLPKLKRLTLHGNPASEIDGYRSIMIHVIPQLKNLDFSPIIKREKNSPPPPYIIKKFGKDIIHFKDY